MTNTTVQINTGVSSSELAERIGLLLDGRTRNGYSQHWSIPVIIFQTWLKSDALSNAYIWCQKMK